MAGTAMAAPLVVRSAGPSAKAYPAGKALADNAKIVLKAGDMLVLLNGKSTRTLTGPGTFDASASKEAATSASSTLAALASSGGERRARIGAVRSVNGTDTSGRNPNVFFVDMNRSSNMCVADMNTVTVWRHDTEKPATVTITRLADGKKATMDMVAGQSRATWPADVAVADGGKYTMSWEGAKAPTAVKFVLIQPSASATVEDLSSTLIKAGCSAQMDLLIATMSPAAVASK